MATIISELTHNPYWLLKTAIAVTSFSDGLRKEECRGILHQDIVEQPGIFFYIEPNAIVKLKLGRRENVEEVIEMTQEGKILRGGSKLKLKV